VRRSRGVCVCIPCGYYLEWDENSGGSDGRLLDFSFVS